VLAAAAAWITMSVLEPVAPKPEPQPPTGQASTA
jgi:hypothetical protein